MTNINETGFGSLDEELEQKAKAIFETSILPTLSYHDLGKYLVIDTQTGEWELDENDFQASFRAYQKNPGARTRYGVRIGHRSVYNILAVSSNSHPENRL